MQSKHRAKWREISLGYIVHVEDFINNLPDKYYGTSYLKNEEGLLRKSKGFGPA